MFYVFCVPLSGSELDSFKLPQLQPPGGGLRYKPATFENVTQEQRCPRRQLYQKPFSWMVSEPLKASNVMPKIRTSVVTNPIMWNKTILLHRRAVNIHILICEKEKWFSRICAVKVRGKWPKDGDCVTSILSVAMETVSGRTSTRPG